MCINISINELELVFLPACKSEVASATALLEKGLKLATRLGEKKATKIAALMMVLSDKLVEQTELDRLWEEFKEMTQLKILEFAKTKWRQEGKLEGELEGKLKGKLEGKVLAYKDMGLTFSEITVKTGLSEKRIVEICENARD